MSQVLTVPKPRRNTELVLLIFALIVALSSYALVDINTGTSLGLGFVLQSLLLVALAIGVHIVLRKRLPYADPVILPLVITINGIGLAMVHRLDISYDSDETTIRQSIWTALAIGSAMTLMWFLRDHKLLRRFTYISLAVSLFLLALPLMPLIGAGAINGADVWIRLGPVTFQPGELAKITLAIFFAGYLSSNRDIILLAGRRMGKLQLPRLQDLFPMVLAWIASVGILAFQRDIGTASLCFGLCIAMIYVATSRVSWVLIGLGFVAVGGVLAYRTFSHVGRRVDAWLNAFSPDVYYQTGGSAQVVNGLFGLANGGLLGTGLGRGNHEGLYLANSDMIVAALGQEVGLIGLIALVLLYLLLVTRGFRASLGTRDAFGKLLAFGLSFVFALQCFIIMGGVTQLIPLTGLTTPLMSAGGSSLVANWIIIALLLLISDAARRPVVTGPSSAPGEVSPGVANSPIERTGGVMGQSTEGQLAK